jgi:hypothetical protein
MFGGDFRFDSFDCLDCARLMILRRSLRGMLLAKQLVAPNIVEANDFPNVLLQRFCCRVRFKRSEFCHLSLEDLQIVSCELQRGALDLSMGCRN